MKKIFIAVFLSCSLATSAQDTFSILAFDSISGEIGAAGASCVNLMGLFAPPADFIAEIFPDTGGVMTQAQYDPANQTNARDRLREGLYPDSLINWLKANDFSSNPHIRQYGVVKLHWVNGLRTAAFTGTNCMDYKNHIVGPNYTIHGNILLGQQILDSMEARFLRTKGDLACKLMSALQGANVSGADTRCGQYGTSSLFAFLKVTLPTDTFGKPSLVLRVRTAPNSNIEPIDSLQKMFTASRSCTVENTSGLQHHFANGLGIFPNPVMKILRMAGPAGATINYTVFELSGRKIMSGQFTETTTLSTEHLGRGLYMVELRSYSQRLRRKVVLHE